MTIDRIYDALVSEEAYALLPGTLADAVEARSCVLQRFDKEGVARDIRYSYFSDEMHLFYGTNEMYRQDIWSSVLADETLIGRALAVDEMITEGRFRASAFYNDFYRQFGDDTGRCIGAGFRQADGGMLSIGLHRAFGEAEFTARALRTLDGLSPHLNRLGALRARLGHVGDAELIARAGFDAIDQPAILADEFARPLIANRAAERLFAEGDGLVFQRGRLCASKTSSHQVLIQAIHEAAHRQNHHGGACLLERPSGGHALRAIVAPLRIGHRTCALILVDDPERHRQSVVSDLSRLYQLTTAEAQIAAALGQGLTTHEIAERRTVSVTTVRTQIQSILRKTETHRVAELVMLVCKIPRPFAGPET